MNPKFTIPSVCATLAAVALASCAAPISYRQQQVSIPSGDFNRAPLSEAVGLLKSVEKNEDPLAAAGRYFDSARAVRDKAVAGDEGAVALYNHAVGRLVESLESAGPLPWGQQLIIGAEDSRRVLRCRPEPDAPLGERSLVVVDTLEFHGPHAGTQATRNGLGAPVVGILEWNGDHRSRFEAPQSYVALTAVLRFDTADSATLELHDPLGKERVAMNGREPVLAANFTAPVALALAQTRVDRLGLIRLLNPADFSNTAGVIRLQKYDKDRIPVVMVHGLQDTPATWVLMYQCLLSDMELRDRFQFWVFCYPSGNPYPHSAALLRQELDGLRQVFPDHKDIVLVGHSMGGLISRLMVTDADDKIWRALFGKAPEESAISGPSRQLLMNAIVFDHREEVDRAVFIAAPHRGSNIASNWIGRTASRLVRLPNYISDVRRDAASLLMGDTAGLRLNLAPNSIDTLSPGHPFVREVNKLPIVTGVPFHSIIGDRGRGDTPDSSDGVVAYWSSHLEGADSEKIVPSNHSAHQNPEVIEEVKRILRLHLKESL